MKKISFIVAFAALSCFAKNYGAAGCGLGSLAFGSDAGMVQVFAATTNGTSYSQIFGITSGTSNCTADGVALNEMEQDFFAEANFESLVQEMAAGHGENLETFAALFNMDIDTFASLVRKDYNNIIANDAPTLLRNLRQVLNAQEA